ncbi:MAG: DUF4340 domain-containing protein [Fischerella sp.]|jgi:hypothetical protein|uniref:DUF4340 domain-containing protein n=1 Tax=Fischerella sp. TaxID=1191 RepID=UPI001846F5A2|nr:DUF4340 domain-containing protein [Fischerella sp.]NWF59281.1 DUF4340 domain-containing protein [Fischerella sp.]
MKLQRTTLILILLALGLGSFVYFYEFRWKTQQEKVQEKKQQIFSFVADDVASLVIKTKKATIILERNQNSERPKWLMKSPHQAPASDAIVSYLMDLLVKGKSDRTLSISANQLPEFGLVQPQATIDIKLKNQKTHQLILGKSDFNRRLLYAQTDPGIKPDGNVNVLLVSTDFENAVNRELSEWKQSTDTGESKPLPSLNLPTPQNTK